jgi:uncharacterized protein YbjQ (UPF0145 family)
MKKGAAGANAVPGIETRVMPFNKAHEMLMIDTAAYHPNTVSGVRGVARLGYMPLNLSLSSAPPSIRSVIGSLKAMLKGLARGEISDLTSLIYDAREHAMELKSEAAEIGADDVLGIKTHIHEFRGLLELMAIVTAVKKSDACRPNADALPVQAITRGKDTWVSSNGLFSRAITAGGDSDT